MVLEGVNGSGKSTIADAIINHYRSSHTSFALYKFPNRNGRIGQRIHGYLTKKIPIESKYEIFDLFARNRMEMRERTMLDVASGLLVICDRYIISAVAYHIPLHVKESHIIDSYCNVVGHFDKHMPRANVVYIIRGDHLAKRDEVAQRFHYEEEKARLLADMIERVVDKYTGEYMIIHNVEGKMSEAVKEITDDINRRV